MEKVEINKKRKRNQNFTKEELELLVELVYKNKDVIENKRTDAVIWKEKEEAWKQIEMEFNSCSLGPRTVEQLKFKYKGMKKDLRKKSARAKLEERKTGGGHNNSVPLDTIDTKMMEMVRLSVEGTPSIFDSDAIDEGGTETYTLEMSPISVDIGHNVLPTPIIVWNEPLPNEDAGRGTQLEADNNPSEDAGTTSRDTGWGVVAPVKLQQKKSTPLRSNKKRYRSTTAEATKVLTTKGELNALQIKLTEQQIDLNEARRRILALEEERLKLEIQLLQTKVKESKQEEREP